MSRPPPTRDLRPPEGHTAYASFSEIAEGRVHTAALSKPTLVDLSHVLEDMVSELTSSGCVITGFQYASNWLSEVARYERLAQTSGRRVAVFTRDVVPAPHRVVPYRIPVGSGLEQEWFILVRTPEFSCALFGLEDDGQSKDDVSELDRTFESGWTFDPELVSAFCEIVVAQASELEEERDALRAELQAIPLVEVGQEVLQRFYVEVFSALERAKRRLRASRQRERSALRVARRSSPRLTRLERLSTLGTTAATFAHEVNNPLQGIMFEMDEILDTADELRAGAAVEEVAATLTTAATDVVALTNRIGRLTRGILDIARDTDIHLERQDLCRWLVERVQELEESFQAQIDLQLPAEQLEGEIDADRLLHIIGNLVRNGVEAGAERPGRIELTLRIEESDMVLRVRDFGPGIPDHIRERLFQPFATSKAGEGGTGLGLALCQRFAADLKGSVELAFSGRQGTAFDICIPVASDETNLHETVGAAEPEARARRRVLVLDDEPSVRRLIGRMLERESYEVLLAATAEEAELAATAHAIDLAIVDYNIGGRRTGVDVVRSLARDGLLQLSSCMVITGNLDTDAIAQEGLPVLKKPFDRQTLIETLATL